MLRSVVVAGVALVAFTGCGGGGPDPASTSSEPGVSPARAARELRAAEALLYGGGGFEASYEWSLQKGLNPEEAARRLLVGGGNRATNLAAEGHQIEAETLAEGLLKLFENSGSPASLRKPLEEVLE